ncbi:MAG: hypothetical protein COB40_11635 [Marinosulfonomonas sp.]|nr:MAG: hypothetical protein COB40_11635 [Marinosulfonomonas sp.]
MIISHTSLAISAARQGVGIALAPSIPVRSDLVSGTLVSPSKTGLPMKKAMSAFFQMLAQSHRFCGCF